tara:strand:- start:527 stop:727 length:201 start_codon:yes stop_codon:yes gene_type:complete
VLAVTPHRINPYTPQGYQPYTSRTISRPPMFLGVAFGTGSGKVYAKKFSDKSMLTSHQHASYFKPD